MAVSRKRAKEVMVAALKLASEAENEAGVANLLRNGTSTALIAIELVEMCGGPSGFLDEEVATKA